jgi:hypothetical protein
MKKILILLTLAFPIYSFALTPLNYCPNITSNLWYGNWYNNRTEVVELQNFLFNYYGVGTSATGFFGPTTKRLIAQFQREQNLYPVTGGVGPLTRSAIQRICDSGGGQTFCTANYQPVCGQPKASFRCLGNDRCRTELQTYGNLCELNRAGAQYLYDGACNNNQTGTAPANCKVWYDGCNTCSRSTVGGPLACTLMYCFQNAGAYCREYFSSSSEAPVIKTFSGPTQLKTGEKGTWRIDASIYNNQQLTYNITWGDEKYDYRMANSVLPYLSSVFPQTTTFEHSYANTGTYTVTITVTAANGQSAKTTTTVNVVANNVVCYDNGVSYNEGQTKSCLYVNGYQTCIADATYICRNGSWKIIGGLPTPTVCSSDARQCPNGTWIGRTGPNCEFLCPAY